MKSKLFLVFFVFMLSVTVVADEYRREINEGYDYYRNGEFDKAAEHFGQAGILKPEKALPNYDKGAATYKSNDYEGAVKEFKSAIEKDDEQYIPDYYYNLGNSFFKAEKYDEAIGSYIQALRLNPDDNDCKHNLELSLLKKQQQQEQQQNQNQNEQQDQQKQDQSQGNQNNQGQERDDQQQAESEEDKQDEKDQRQEAGEQQEMTEQDAKNLLARFEEDEKEIQRRLKQARIGRSSANDW